MQKFKMIFYSFLSLIFLKIELKSYNLNLRKLMLPRFKI